MFHFKKNKDKITIKDPLIYENLLYNTACIEWFFCFFITFKYYSYLVQIDNSKRAKIPTNQHDFHLLAEVSSRSIHSTQETG